MTAREVIARLSKEGWQFNRQSGSHAQYTHPDKPGARVTVAMHRGDIHISTLRNIYRQAGWDWR